MLSHSSFDRWLNRVGSFSQILVCAFTAWAIFYTVIPLYKVALLEESIARREIELSAKNEELRGVKELLEDMGDEVYERERKEIVHNFVHDVVGKCTNFSLVMSEAGDVDRFDPYKALKDTDYSSCVLSIYSESKAKSLFRDVDYDFVKEQMVMLSANFDRARLEALGDMDSIEERAQKDPSILAPKGKYLAEFEAFAQSLGIPKPTAKQELDGAIGRTRLDIFMKHSQMVRDKLFDFRLVKLPG